MKDYQQRVVDEKAELDAKRERLGAFKNTGTFLDLPWQEQERLNTQGHLMCMYSAVLGERIAAFGHTVNAKALSHAVNCLGIDNAMNTPDFKLAEKIAVLMDEHEKQRAEDEG